MAEGEGQNISPTYSVIKSLNSP